MKNRTLFGLVLKRTGNRIVLSTSTAFRIVFVLTAAAIAFAVVVSGDGPFLQRFGFVSVFVVAVCLIAALYLERWTFDKSTDLFEENAGLVIAHSCRRRRLSTLEKVVLRETEATNKDRPRFLRAMYTGAATLSVVDRDGTIYTLDVARMGPVANLRRSAGILSRYCGIPLEQHRSHEPQHGHGVESR